MKELLGKNKVVPAFGFSTAEIARAIVDACEEQDQDVILMTSISEAEFLGLEAAAGIAKALGARAKISVSLHLDHAKNLEIIKKALGIGYSSVMADGSDLGFEESIDFVRSCTRSTRANALVEASLTRFDRATEFVEKAKPDLLAPFEVINGRDQTTVDKIRCVKQFVNVPLVLHNSSSKSAEEIKEAVSLGFVKVNWNTSLRQAWARGLRDSLKADADEIKPYVLLSQSVAEVKRAVAGKVKLLI